ncbi:MAG TPA: tetratricopeptide repeat protein [Bacteroidia bacterium]|nr:tetratricopeptide repeat protein [Bacteroidia bacterium]
MRKFLCCILIFLAHIYVFAQKNTDEQLANQFFQNKEYDKASIYFEKLYDKNSDAYYNPYFKCLLATHNLKKAEKIAKRQIKSYPPDLFYYVDLAQVYQADSNATKAKDQYTKAIKELGRDVSQTLDLGKAFIGVKEYDYAIETYKKGRKYNGQIYPFFYEMADVYKAKGDIRAMINEYLDAISFKETDLQNVEMQLQNSLGYDDEKGGFNNPILKQELQKRIQQHPDQTVFSDFLIYILVQQKDFESAFIQSKALDKRSKEEGFRIMDLGKLCVLNEDFETAQKCYDYVIAKGKDNFNYSQACIESANAQFEKIIKQKNYTQTDLTEVEQKLKNTIKQFGYNQLSVSVVHKLAILQGFYLNKVQEAIDMLNEVLSTPGIDKASSAELKLDLGDLLLIAGDVWDASLSYSQVEKAYKYDPIGQEAKFRNAKIAFYTGDFKWAKAQLDVLKGATSKLISNDAMDLSLVISDAIGVDTNEVPLQMFASADLLLLQHKNEQGLRRLDSINILFDNHSLADDIYFKKAQVFTQEGKYKEALEAYQRVVDVYGDKIYGDDAMFKMAEIYQYNLKDIEKAKALYQEFLTKYPGSVYTVEARKRFRKLRGDVIN